MTKKIDGRTLVSMRENKIWKIICACPFLCDFDEKPCEFSEELRMREKIEYLKKEYRK